MKTASVLALVLLTAISASAASNQQAPVPQATDSNPDASTAISDGSSSRKTKYESWYWGFGLYSGGVWYGKEIDDALKTLKGLPGYERTPAAFDLVFTWPSENKKWTLGAGFIGIVDTIKANGYELSIIQRSLNFSARFYSGEAAEGFFLRGDAGIGAASFEAKRPDGVVFARQNSKTGGDVAFGSGYSLPLSDETRLDLHVLFSALFIEGDRALSLIAGVGLLF